MFLSTSYLQPESIAPLYCIHICVFVNPSLHSTRYDFVQISRSWCSLASWIVMIKDVDSPERLDDWSQTYVCLLLQIHWMSQTLSGDVLSLAHPGTISSLDTILMLIDRMSLQTLQDRGMLHKLSWKGNVYRRPIGTAMPSRHKLASSFQVEKIRSRTNLHQSTVDEMMWSVTQWQELAYATNSNKRFVCRAWSQI